VRYPNDLLQSCSPDHFGFFCTTEDPILPQMIMDTPKEPEIAFACAMIFMSLSRGKIKIPLPTPTLGGQEEGCPLRPLAL